MFLRPEGNAESTRTEWLTRRLLNPSEYVDNRRAAAQALARTPAAHGLLALAAALDDPDNKVREHAWSGLTATGRGVVRRLLPLVAVASPNAELAARALGVIGDRSAVEVLLSALDDVRPTVAAEAAIALGWLGETRAVEPLCALLETGLEFTEEWAVLRRCRDAARALGRVGDARAVDTLCRSLQAPEVIAEAAAQALGAIGNPWACEPLIAALAGIAPSYRAQRSTLRVTLYETLGRIADPRVVRPLCQALSDSVPRVRQTAAACIEPLPDDVIREGLEANGGWACLPAALAVREYAVTWQAIRAAGVSSRPELLPALRKFRLPWVAQPLVAAAEQAMAAIDRGNLSSHPIPAFPPEVDPRHLPVVIQEIDVSAHNRPLPAPEPNLIES